MKPPTLRNLLYFSIALIINMGILFGFKFWSSPRTHVSLPADQFSTEIAFGKKKTKPSPPDRIIARPSRQQEPSPVQRRTVNPPLNSGTVEKDPSRSTSPDIQEQNNEVQAYLREIVKIINKKKRYPRLSRENGEEGQVLIRLVIGKSGELLSYKIIKNSPHERLDRATTTTVRSASFPPLPQALEKKPLVIEVPVRYRLSQTRG